MAKINFISSAHESHIIEMSISASPFGRASITLHREVRNVVTHKSILTIYKIE
jgi:acyl-CoA thioesterase YciA